MNPVVFHFVGTRAQARGGPLLNGHLRPVPFDGMPQRFADRPDGGVHAPIDPYAVNRDPALDDHSHSVFVRCFLRRLRRFRWRRRRFGHVCRYSVDKFCPAIRHPLPEHLRAVFPRPAVVLDDVAYGDAVPLHEGRVFCQA